MFIEFIMSGNDVDEDTDHFINRLDKFRRGFALFIEDEKAKANIRSTKLAVRTADCGCSNGEIDIAITVLRDLKEGEELLRPYGREVSLFPPFFIFLLFLLLLISQGDDGLHIHVLHRFSGWQSNITT